MNETINRLIARLVESGGSIELHPTAVQVVQIMPEVTNPAIRPYVAPVSMYRGEAHGVTLYACELLEAGFWRIVAPFRGGVMVTPYLSPEEEGEAWELQKAGL